MQNVKYFTLAALRNEDPIEFDNAFKEAVEKAALIVGRETVIQALCGQNSDTKAQRLAA